MKKWKKVVEQMEKGKSFKEVTREVPLVVKVKQNKFKINQISTKQQDAIRRG